MKQTIFLTAVFLILLMPVGSALESGSVSLIPIKNVIFNNETAIFNVTLVNSMPLIDDIEIFSPDVVTWDVFTVPRSDYRVTVYPETTKNILLYVKPLYVTTGIYDVRLEFISHRTKQKIRANLGIEVVSAIQEVKSYVPIVKSTLDVPEEVDPRQPVKFSLLVRNIAPIWMDNVRIRLKSALIDQSYTTALGPKEEKELEFVANFDPYQAPRSDKLGGEIIYLTENKSHVFDIPKVSFKVNAYAEFTSRMESKSTFFSSESTYTITNEGNIKKSDDVTIPYRFLDILFSTTDPDSKKGEKDGIAVHTWSLTLGPDQSTPVTIKRNYLALYALLSVVIFIFIFYYVFRSPVILQKSAKKLMGENETLRSLKVRVYVKNRTNKVLEEVKIVDRIPQMIEVDKDFQVGTIKPDKVLKHTGRSTKVIWNIPVLESYEERIITYRLRSTLSIFGGLTLPKAYIRFKQENGKQRTTMSKKFIVLE